MTIPDERPDAQDAPRITFLAQDETEAGTVRSLGWDDVDIDDTVPPSRMRWVIPEDRAGLVVSVGGALLPVGRDAGDDAWTIGRVLYPDGMVAQDMLVRAVP